MRAFTHLEVDIFETRHQAERSRELLQACADRWLAPVGEEIDLQGFNISAEDVGHCNVEIERAKVEAGRQHGKKRLRRSA
jgi:hypothetical protein